MTNLIPNIESSPEGRTPDFEPAIDFVSKDHNDIFPDEFQWAGLQPANLQMQYCGFIENAAKMKIWIR